MHMSILGLVVHNLMKIAAIWAGSSTTKSALLTAVILSGALSDINETQMLEFIYFTAQIRSRNLNIQNFLFVINWNVLLAVSLSLNNNCIYISILIR